MKNFCVQFCSAIKALRDRAGKGQIAFARELGLSQPVYARYEKGDREPTLNELIRIAHVLNTTPNVLLGFEAPPPLRDSAPPRETKIRTGDNSQVAIGNNITQVNTIKGHKKMKFKKNLIMAMVILAAASSPAFTYHGSTRPYPGGVSTVKHKFSLRNPSTKKANPVKARKEDPFELQMVLRDSATPKGFCGFSFGQPAPTPGGDQVVAIPHADGDCAISAQADLARPFREFKRAIFRCSRVSRRIFEISIMAVPPPGIRAREEIEHIRTLFSTHYKADFVETGSKKYRMIVGNAVFDLEYSDYISKTVTITVTDLWWRLKALEESRSWKASRSNLGQGAF